MSVLLINGCATPPDVPACEQLSQRLYTDPVTTHLVLAPSPTCMREIGEVGCGHCVYIVSGKEIFIGERDGHLLNNKPWSKLKASAIYLPAAESYAPIAAYMINACKKMNCNDDVDQFKVKLGTLGAVQSVSK